MKLEKEDTKSFAMIEKVYNLLTEMEEHTWKVSEKSGTVADLCHWHSTQKLIKDLIDLRDGIREQER